jgi:hypothetical protein
VLLTWHPSTLHCSIIFHIVSSSCQFSFFFPSNSILFVFFFFCWSDPDLSLTVPDFMLPFHHHTQEMRSYRIKIPIKISFSVVFLFSYISTQIM